MHIETDEEWIIKVNRMIRNRNRFLKYGKNFREIILNNYKNRRKYYEKNL